jgi:hypothetical protein
MQACRCLRFTHSDVASLTRSSQVLIVRTDLNMSSGKIAAQCSHATLACYKALSAKNPKVRSLGIILGSNLLTR